MKDKIYSSVEDKFINIMDVEKIIVEIDDMTDVGYFKVIAFLSENDGWERFTGDIDDDNIVNGGWTEDGLRGLAEVRNDNGGKCSVVVIDDLYTKPNFKLNEAEMWAVMWANIKPRALKFVKDIKRSQFQLRMQKIDKCFNIKKY